METQNLPAAMNGTPLPLSSREHIPFVPKTCRDEKSGEPVAGARTYYLVAPKGRRREAILAELVRTGGSLVGAEEIREALEEAARIILDDGPRQELTDALTQLRAFEKHPNPSDAMKDQAVEWRRLITKYERMVSRDDDEAADPLREVLAKVMRQNQRMSELTVRACVRDWEGVAEKYQRKGNFLTLDALSAIPGDDYDELVGECERLRALSPDQERSSASQ